MKQKENYKQISFDKKISRNEPCPCGSGKKYQAMLSRSFVNLNK